ncbi:mannosyl-glycoprotein endo-beta-N-acetylglucosamidase [Salinisphaera dokdonensis CL-ES53]|uniref:Peptidoglycan hydrolase FlgJ n=1 Tax=Salinisphaera dokdonensis CL-ES53 TaxID=1304272 RepID=A0ABV2AYB0_9GAMM
MNSGGASGEFALSVQSISKLKYSARRDPEEGVRQAAKQFEALFLQQMLKQMRAAVPESGLLQSQQSDMYQSLMDQQWSQTLAERGVGLADMLTRQLQGSPKAADAAAADAANGSAFAGIPTAAPQPLRASDPIDASRAKAMATAVAAKGAEDKPRPPLQAAQTPVVPAFAAAVESSDTSAADKVRRAVMPKHVNDFLDRMESAAQVASDETGLPKRLILAQAALETGWGRHEIRHADGSRSYNVFNIKATGWQGDSAEVTTTEFAGSRAYKTRAAFRAYESYEHAFSDYARLISESPRYAPVVNAPTAEDAARALQNCGYATDPAYAEKLVSIMSRLPEDTAGPVAAAPLVDTAGQAPVINTSAGVGAPQVLPTEGVQIARADRAGVDLSQLF